MANGTKIHGTTTVQRASLKALLDMGGAVITSEWTNGTGRYTTRRALPPFCKSIPRYLAAHYPARIQKVFRAHPRCHAVIAVTNMRAANRVLRAAESPTVHAIDADSDDFRRTVIDPTQ